MKILHYVDENNLSWARPWCQLLAGLRERGCENVIVCRPGGTLSPLLQESGFSVRAYKPFLTACPRTALGFARIAQEETPDLIHTRLSSAARIGGYWGKRLGVPVISTIDKHAKLKYYSQADFIVGCSTAVSQHMERSGFPQARIVTIHNSVDLEYYARDQKSRKAFRKTAGIGDEDVVILGMGRLVSGKAFDTLIRACASIKSPLKWKLWLVGKGPDEQRLRHLVSKYGLEKKVDFWGHASDVRPFLWGSDLFVQPSREPEGFSLALLEAMASALPAMASNIGGSSDILDDKEGGRLFAADDPNILREHLEWFLALNVTEREGLAHEAKLVASGFSTHVTAQCYEELYKRVLQKRQTIKKASPLPDL